MTESQKVLEKQFLLWAEEVMIYIYIKYDIWHNIWVIDPLHLAAGGGGVSACLSH
jgi:hypothetical protein